MSRNILKIMSKTYQSEFSHRYACWANNHRGWSKQKKKNRRIAKKRLKRAYIEVFLKNLF